MRSISSRWRLYAPTSREEGGGEGFLAGSGTGVASDLLGWLHCVQLFTYKKTQQTNRFNPNTPSSSC